MLKENAKKLKLRPDDFESVLCKIGFGPAHHVGITGEGGGSVNVRILHEILFLFQGSVDQLISTPSFEVIARSLSPWLHSGRISKILFNA